MKTIKEGLKMSRDEISHKNSVETIVEVLQSWPDEIIHKITVKGLQKYPEKQRQKCKFLKITWNGKFNFPCELTTALKWNWNV